MTDNECKGATFKARISNHIGRSDTRSRYVQTAVMTLVKRKMCGCAVCADLVSNFYKYIDKTKTSVMPEPVKPGEFYKLVFSHSIYWFQLVDGSDQKAIEGDHWSLKDATHASGEVPLKVDLHGRWAYWRDDRWMVTTFNRINELISKKGIRLLKTNPESTDMSEKEEDEAMDQMSKERGPTKDFRP